MIAMLQRDICYPLIFRIIPGNIIDMNTRIRSVNVLDYIGNIETDYILSDAIYYTFEDIHALYRANIDFLMRPPEKYRLYRDLIGKYGPELKTGKKHGQI